ncbi:MAG: phospholipase D-like domain-containing protein [Planctomycetota bacterium]
MASACFNPQGLELLARDLGHVPRVRLLLGADPTPEALRPRRRPTDPREPEFTRRRLRASLCRMEEALQADRNRIPFDLEGDRALRTLLDFLHSGRIEVRRYEGHFLHTKAFLFHGEDRGLLSGSSNLTRAGLQSNLELNLGHWANPLLARVEAWYDALWEEAVPFDLAAVYEQLLAEYPPYLIYLKVLWHLYHKELAEEEEEAGHIPVTTFQRHGVCPASLRDTTWKKFLNDYQLLVECLSYEELAQDPQLGGDHRHLSNPLEDYALVVVDEAHNYRNPDAPTRAGVLRRLLAGKRRDLVLLTATPVNNSLWDLYHELRFFLKQDAALAHRGVLSIRERFEEAMRVDPFDLDPDHLYPIIDASTVKRTRRFVKRHYQGDMIGGPGGLVPIRFPSSRGLDRPLRPGGPPARLLRPAGRGPDAAGRASASLHGSLPARALPGRRRRREYRHGPGRAPALRAPQALRVFGLRVPPDRGADDRPP